MRYKVWQSIWLLALLILLRSGDFGALAAGDDTYNYNQQVIVILRNDQSTLEAAWYLYGKHPSTSFIVELNNEGLEQVNVKWDLQQHSPYLYFCSLISTIMIIINQIAITS